MTGKGLVYVMYHTKTLEDAETAQPVKIHFASGTVNGYFDSQKEEHQGRWSELLGKATDKYFDVVGKYAHLTFETNDFGMIHHIYESFPCHRQFINTAI